MSGEKDYSTLVELLQYRSQHQSNRTAYTFLADGENEAVSMTYQQLDLQAKVIACSLQSRQMAGNTALLVYPYDGGLEFIAAFFGCLYANAIAVPCHPPRNRHASQDLAARLASSQAKIVLTTKNTPTQAQKSASDSRTASRVANYRCSFPSYGLARTKY